MRGKFVLSKMQVACQSFTLTSGVELFLLRRADLRLGVAMARCKLPSLTCLPCMSKSASFDPKLVVGEEGKLVDETIGGPSLGQYFDLLSECFDLTPEKECQARYGCSLQAG